MSKSKCETESVHEAVVVSSTPEARAICWNTGEEKNCAACYLTRSCKAKS